MAKNGDKEADIIPSDDSEESAPSGGKKKLIIIIAAAALVLIVGGGGGAYFFLGRSEPVEEPVVEEPALPVEAKPILVLVRKVVAPVAENGSVTGYVYLDLNVEVADEETAQKLKDEMPVLRDAFARDLYSNSIADPNAPGRADVSAIQARLLEAARKVFGADAIRQMYVSNVTYSGL
jgi:flagellar protein FliL